MPLPRRNAETGASLVEVLVALLVTAVGTLSVASLMAYGTSLQVTSRDTTSAAAIGRQQFERLRMLPPLSPERAVGGSLTADAANHFRVVATTSGPLRCRWVVTTAAAGTKEINLVVLTPRNLQLAQIGGAVWP